MSYRISEKLSRHAWEVKKRNHVFRFAAGDQVLFVFSHPPVEPEKFKRSTIQNHNCNNGGRLVKWNVLAFDLDTLFVLLNQCCIAFLSMFLFQLLSFSYHVPSSNFLKVRSVGIPLTHSG